jgi:hypothetical protein
VKARGALLRGSPAVITKICGFDGLYGPGFGSAADVDNPLLNKA